MGIPLFTSATSHSATSGCAFVVARRGETTHSGVDVNNTHLSMINPLNYVLFRDRTGKSTVVCCTFWKRRFTLQWRQITGVSIVCSIGCLGASQPTSPAVMRGIRRSPVDFPLKRYAYTLIRVPEHYYVTRMFLFCLCIFVSNKAFWSWSWSQRASNTENVSIRWRHSEATLY